MAEFEPNQPNGRKVRIPANRPFFTNQGESYFNFGGQPIKSHIPAGWRRKNMFEAPKKKPQVVDEEPKKRSIEARVIREMPVLEDQTEITPFALANPAVLTDFSEDGDPSDGLDSIEQATWTALLLEEGRLAVRAAELRES
jgi:hypothetical protein